MKKILLVANTDWYLYNFRMSLARFLKASGFEVIFVAPSGEYQQKIINEGVGFIPWQVKRRSMFILGELIALIRLLLIYYRQKPCLVHHFTVKPVLYGSIAARIGGVGAIVNSITGLGYIFLSKDCNLKLLQKLLVPVYRFAFHQNRLHLIFENPDDLEMLESKNMIRKSQSSVIQGVGVDERVFSQTPDPNNEVPTIILPARMLYDKGVEDFVNAAKMVRLKRKAKFILVGDVDPGNPSMIRKETLQRWVTEEAIEWWGFQGDMPNIFQNCNIVTLPSFGEGLPTVLIEAAACGRPLVATDVPGCRDVVMDGVNGYLVPVNDVDALAAAMIKLIDSPEKRQAMGNESRKLVLEKFTAEMVNQATFTIYKQLIEKSDC